MSDTAGLPQKNIVTFVYTLWEYPDPDHPERERKMPKHMRPMRIDDEQWKDAGVAAKLIGLDSPTALFRQAAHEKISQVKQEHPRLFAAAVPATQQPRSTPPKPCKRAQKAKQE